jgi:hypothetical protein
VFIKVLFKTLFKVTETYGKIIFLQGKIFSYLLSKLFIRWGLIFVLYGQHFSSREKLLSNLYINFGPFSQKKTDALVGRVSTFCILQTNELSIFPEIHHKYPKLQNLRIVSKHS